MATTMVPPAPTPAAAARPTPGATRYVSVRANLLPDEIVSGRQTEVVRKQVVLGLIVVVALLIAGFGFSWWQTSAANSDLSDAQHQGVALQNQQQEFGPLVKAQTDAQSIQAQLQKLMVGDLSWKTMLTTVRTVAPSGVTLTNVNAILTTGAAAASGPSTTADANSLNQTGQLSIGQLTIIGQAPNQNAVAAFADRVSKVKGLTAALPTTVATTAGVVTYTMTAIITSDALGGRYAPKSTSTTGGK
jgi:hypothetical protein